MVWSKSCLVSVAWATVSSGCTWTAVGSGCAWAAVGSGCARVD